MQFKKSGFSQEFEEMIKLLSRLENVQLDYPAEWLAERRASFLEQLARLKSDQENKI